MQVAASCDSANGWTLQLEPGVSRGDPAAACAFVESLLSGYQESFEQRWGPGGASGWRIRIRATAPAASGQAGMFVAGETWWTERIIDLYQGSLQVFDHELYHVRLGAASIDHHGWACPGGFGDWEVAEGLMPNSTESGYLPKC